MSLNQKTAFITGGTKGIGLAIARAMLAEGMKVAFTGRHESSVSELEAALNGQYPGQVLGLVSDVRDYNSQFQAVSEMQNKWGSLDVLIANAGVGHFHSIDEMSIDHWNEVIDVNLTGVFYSLKASMDALKKSKGYFISIASLAGTNFFARGTAYNASKFGLVGFTQAAMLDLRDAGIKSTTIMPGSVATFFNNRIPSEADAWKIQPEDIGQMVIDLLKMPARTLPSKIEVRPSVPPSKK